MRLSGFVDDNIGEVLSLEKFALSSLTSGDNDRYIIDNLFFNPLFDCHEVIELVRLEVHNTLFDIFHKCPLVSSCKPLFIELNNLFLFFFLFLLFLFIFFTMFLVCWILLRLRLLLTMNLALGADASEVGHTSLFLFFFFVLCKIWFSSIVIRDDLYSTLLGKSDEGTNVIEIVLRLLKSCSLAISDDSGKQCERLHVIFREIEQILSLSGVVSDHLVVQ